MIYKNEDFEQYNLVQWLELHWYKFTAIPNSTYSKSWKQKRKNYDMWLRPWMSDLIIILKRKNVLFLEMKKKKWPRWWNNWSVISVNQKKWMEEINECKNVQYIVCFWYKDAITKIQLLENA